MTTPPKSSSQMFREALLMLAPGTLLREGISAILQSGTGALLCIGNIKRLSNLSEGGVKLDAAMTPQLLYELSKMDGALLLNEDGSRIFYANRFLKPNARIPSEETGTRHRVAQRLAFQARCIVVAVSQRRSSVTLYAYDRRLVLDSIPTLVNKAMQALQTLEKYIAVLRLAEQELTLREFQNVATIFDVCKTVQRTEMVFRIAQEIEPYILELGTEGRLLALQLEEMLMPVHEASLVVRDYYREQGGRTLESVQSKIGSLTQPELLQLGNICQALGYGSSLRSVDTYLSPRGFRVLTSTHRFSPQIIENLVNQFGSLRQIMRAPKDELVDVDGVGDVLAERIRVSLDLMRNRLTPSERT